MVNGERSDCLLADVVVTGNKRRSQCGSAETRKDVEVADKAAPPQQVWGLEGMAQRGLPPTALSCSEFHFVNYPVAPKLPWEL